MGQLYTDFWIAVGFFTRLPTPTLHGAIAMSRALGFAPIVGAGIGWFAGNVVTGAQSLGLPVAAGALIAVALAILLTGALHEDGLADCADGFGGGRTIAAKLEIMKDSRIGSYGTLALIVAVGLRVAAIAALPEATSALIAAHAGARGGFAAALRYLPSARAGGLADLVGQPGATTTAISLIASGGLVVWFGGAAALAAAIGAGMTLLWLARRQIGGVTGDVLGALAVLVEIAVLLTLSVAR